MNISVTSHTSRPILGRPVEPRYHLLPTSSGQINIFPCTTRACEQPTYFSMSDTSIDQARKDLLTQLAAMGVVLPRGTKMTNDALEKRLSQALDASQTLHEVIPSTPFNPDSFPPWDMSKSLLKAVHRGNVMEAVMNAATSSRTELGGGQSVPPSQENIFMEVRQCMLQFAKHFEDRHSTFVLQDKAQESGLIIRVREPPVLMFDSS